MALSDKEIEYLIEKAESYIDINKNRVSVSNLKEALKCYDHIIENAPPHSHYFVERGKIKLRLADYYDWDDAIEDINKAVELDPDTLRIRRILLMGKLKDKDISDNNRNQLLRKIMADCKASLERDPTIPEVWLDLMEINVLLHNWDEAISIYGSCQLYMKDKEDQLIRACLGCLALTLAGDPLEEEDKEPLYDQTIRLRNVETVFRISSFLSKISGVRGAAKIEGKRIAYFGYVISNSEIEAYKEKWKKANDINELFINHTNEFDKGTLLHSLERYGEALAAIDRAIVLHPEDAEIWVERGNLLRTLARYEDALKAYDKATELIPTYAYAWYQKGRMCALKKFPNEADALESLAKAVDIDGQYKARAKTDRGFMWFWYHEEFIALTT